MKIVFLLLSFFSIQVFAKSDVAEELNCLRYINNTVSYYKTALVANKKSKDTFFVFHKDQIYSCVLDNTVKNKLITQANFALKFGDQIHRSSYNIKNDKLVFDRPNGLLKSNIEVQCQKTDKVEEAKSALSSHINDTLANYPVQKISNLSPAYTKLKSIKDSCESLNDGEYKFWIRKIFSKVYHERERPKKPSLSLPNNENESGAVQ